MIKIIVNTSNATENEIKELNKLIPFDKSNIEVEFITKEDIEIAKTAIPSSKEINNALSWYKVEGINVVRTDFETENVLSVIIEGDKHLELSNKEVKYRAELWKLDN
ncbi:hypothetical protein [Aliarcobacter butzleri]|uniref:hypothetical protein n=1 Tax=Aliarcobacter butzleri TaxID=28197 RepID=UPI002B246040|nr:hypothetical protein [Aliarcobacter butzleri]